MQGRPILRRTHQKGFTIVELLIVVVVIAILAAITIVAYGGIARQAKESAAKNSIASAQKKLATWYIQNGETFPLDLNEAGIIGTGTVSYQYTVNNNTNPRGYCVTVIANDTAYRLGNNFTYTSGATNTINESSHANGVCPGHSGSSNTPAIVNLATNPSAEVSAAGFLGPNGTVIAHSTARAQSGTGSVLGTMPASHPGSNVGISIYRAATHAAGGLKPNTTYSISAWVYAPTGVVGQEVLVQGNGRTSPLNPPERFWVDSVMLVEGTEAPNYADGNSPGWVWNGTAGLSASTGPRL